MEVEININDFKQLQDSLTSENAEEKLKNTEFPFHAILPINIGGVQCERPCWNDFKGSPDSKNEYFLAYIYWVINYFYDTTKKFCEQEKVMKFIVTSITAQPKIKPNSWYRYKTKDLLHHETGHYIIACLCTLEFKKRVMEKNASFYTSSHAKEITQIFNDTMKEFCDMERLYDEETCHYLNEQKQKEWNIKLIQKLLYYKQHFQIESVPDSKILLGQIQDQLDSHLDIKSIIKYAASKKKMVAFTLLQIPFMYWLEKTNKNQAIQVKICQYIAFLCSSVGLLSTKVLRNKILFFISMLFQLAQLCIPFQ
ncbi:hypothetical protein ABPG72_001750 [Tetrahymena utriculariae]